MANKKNNELAAIEKAISNKYGDEAIQNPKANWDQDKEREYLTQMRELYNKIKIQEDINEKVDIKGAKVSKRILNRNPLKSCSICGSFPKRSMDDVCLIKFECCNVCYVKYIEDREERWIKGWRPTI